MAIYTSIADVKAETGDTDFVASTEYDATILTMIENASRLIDLEVGGWPNYFAPTTDGETRYFDGSGEEEQPIDPLVTLTSVHVAESGGRAVTDYTAWTENTDFYTWPYNFTAVAQPIRKLIVDNDSGSKGRFPRFRKAVKVIGIFGYSASTPEAIEQACKIQSVRWFQRAKQMYQDASSNVATGQLLYAQTLDPDVKRLLQSYKIWSL